MRMPKIKIDQLEGGAALCDWFGDIPTFHDANLKELELHQGAPGRLVAHIFGWGPEVDAKGYYVIKKRTVVTLSIINLVEVQLFEMKEGGIIFGLEIEKDDEGTTLIFDSSYGVHGRIKAERIVVSFEPVEPT